MSEQITRSQYPATVERPAAAPGACQPVSRRSGPAAALQFFNGLGGFASSGREYVIGNERRAAHAGALDQRDCESIFGFLVSESGSGFTWSLNSHENQLTPWSNDHVSDPPGEAIYIRDESTGEIWTPTALPIRDEGCVLRGAARPGLQPVSAWIARNLQRTWCNSCPRGSRSKYRGSRLQNDSGRTRRLSVTAYVEWVLGSSRSASAPYIITEMDSQTGAIFARSAWNGEFGGRVAFADLERPAKSYTGDRTEFLGRNGTPERPAALERARRAFRESRRRPRSLRGAANGD